MVEPICKEDFENKINMVMRQTDYTREIVIKKLEENNNDHLRVIKDYLGVTEKKELKNTSVNQQIYKHLRYHLDNSMRDYHKRVENGEAKKIM